jgi:hypothetical protein
LMARGDDAGGQPSGRAAADNDDISNLSNHALLW